MDVNLNQDIFQAVRNQASKNQALPYSSASQFINLLDHLKPDYDTQVDLTNSIYGKYNPFKIKVDDKVVDLVLNEIKRRYWIICSTNGENNALANIFLMPKAIIVESNKELTNKEIAAYTRQKEMLQKYNRDEYSKNKLYDLKSIIFSQIDYDYTKFLPETIQEFNELTKPKTNFLQNLPKSWRKLVFDWTLKHQWIYLSSNNLSNILKEIGNERGFYFQSYKKMLTALEWQNKEYQTLSNEQASKAIAKKIQSYFNDVNLIQKEITDLENNQQDHTLTNAESERLSLLNWISVLINLNNNAFNKDYLEKLISAIKSTTMDHIFDTSQLRLTFQQYDIKTFNHVKLLNALLKDFLVTSLLNEELEEAVHYSLLHYFYLYFTTTYFQNKEDKKNNANSSLLEALWIDSYFFSQASITLDLKDFTDFKNTFLQDGIFLQKPVKFSEIKEHLVEFEQKIEQFYWKYNAWLDVDLLKAFDVTWNELKLNTYGNYKLFKKEEYVDVYGEYCALCKKKINKYEKLLNENDWSNEEEKTKVENALNYWQNELKTFKLQHTWLKDTNHTLYDCMRDLSSLKSKIAALHYYVNFETTNAIYGATFDDISKAKTSINAESEIAWNFNFCPNRMNEQNTFIKIFDPLLDLNSLNINKRLCFGLDSYVLNKKICVFLNKFYLSQDYNTKGILKWRAEHNGLIGLLQFYFQLLSLSNQAPSYWNWPLEFRQNTFDRILISVADASFLRKLDTNYDVYLGDGDDGKSAWKKDIISAFGVNNVLERNKGMVKSENQFTQYSMVGKYIDYQDDVGAEIISKSIDSIKAASTNDSTLNFEIKQENGVGQAASWLKIIINTNDINKDVSDSKSGERRLRLFKVANLQERINKNLNQESLFNKDLVLANRSKWIMPLALNTYCSYLYFDKNPYTDKTLHLNRLKNNPRELLADTEDMELNKRTLGTDDIEKYIMSMLVVAKNLADNVDGITEKTTSSLDNAVVEENVNEDTSKKTSQNKVGNAGLKSNGVNYLWFHLSFQELYNHYAEWMREFINKDYRNNFRIDTFRKRILNAMSKNLWSKAFEVKLLNSTELFKINYEQENWKERDYKLASNGIFHLLIPINKWNLIKKVLNQHIAGQANTSQYQNVALDLDNNDVNNLTNDYEFLTTAILMKLKKEIDTQTKPVENETTKPSKQDQVHYQWDSKYYKPIDDSMFKNLQNAYSKNWVDFSKKNINWYELTNVYIMNDKLLDYYDLTIQPHATENVNFQAKATETDLSLEEEFENVLTEDEPEIIENATPYD